MKVVIIDYGVGNLTSVQNAFAMLGVEADISSNPVILLKSTHLILPGVGSFGEGMDGLTKRGLVEVLKEAVIEEKKKILGICLGMQLFATVGFEYGEHKGLGFVPGKVTKIDIEKSHARLPHMGWNDVELRGTHGIISGFHKAPVFYFVHSYQLEPEEKEVIAAVVSYGDGEVVAIIEKDNVYGTQFHPEKSHTDGLQVLKNFLTA